MLPLLVSRATATGTTEAGWIPYVFMQEPVYEAGQERAPCLPGFCAALLEAHAAPQPTASGMLITSLCGDSGTISQAEGDMWRARSPWTCPYMPDAQASITGQA